MISRYRILSALFCAMVIAFATAACNRPPKTDMKAVDALLKELVTKHGGNAIELDPTPIKGDFGNLTVVRFYIQTGGNKVPGLAFVSGNKVLVGGTLLEIPSGKNLSQELAGKPIPVALDMGQFDLVGRVPLGSKSAKTVVIEFSDFQCPYCRAEASVVKDVLKKHAGEIVLYYKHFPLANIHPLAMKMSIAVECAKAQRPDSFWTFHDRLLFGEELRSLDEVRSKGRAWAKAAQLDEAKWLACYDKDGSAAVIQKDVEEGRRIGVSGTPSFVINGHLIVGAVPVKDLEEAVAGKAK